MFLSSIEIFGFKSFADKSRIPFDKGVSIIVGPNGCGKSNVVDALRWVLGEQGAKGLRADKMVGVIFNGTDTRHPLNVAEVSLTFSNEKNILPLEYSEVEIKRRVFRDGTSEYYINKNQVPLREIRELLSDTGVGTTEYVVMEQGRMDQILEAKPAERREILEEAAGIAKHRMRSLEGTRRLEKVQANKQQLLQVLKEVEAHHKTLKDQCAKALQYRELKESIFSREVTRVCAKYNDMRAVSEKFSSDKAQAERDAREKIAAMENLTRESEGFAGEAKEHQRTIAAESEKISSLTAHMEGAQERIKKSEEYRGSVSEQITLQREQLTRAQETTKQHKKECDDIGKTIAALKSRLAETDAHIASSRQEAQKAADEIASLDASIRASFEEDKKIEAELDTHQKDLRLVVDRLAAELDKQLTKTGYSAQAQKERAQAIEKHIKTALSLAAALAKKSDASASGELAQCIKAIEDEFTAYRKSQPTFLQDFLEGDGVLSRKHIIDAKISSLYARRSDLMKQRDAMQRQQEKAAKAQAKHREALQEHNVRKASIEREAVLLAEQEQAMRRMHDESLAQEKAQSQNIERMIQSEKQLAEDIGSQQKHLKNLQHEKQQSSANLEKLRAKIEAQNSKVAAYSQRIVEADRAVKALHAKVRELEQKEADTAARCAVVAEQFAERYGELLSVYLVKDEYKNLSEKDTDAQRLADELQKAKDKLKALGGVNLLAPDEFRQVNERYEFLTSQLADLESAEEDLKKVVEEIEKESRQKLEETYREVRKHFKRIFTKLMDGGFADITLVDSEDILSAGLEIVAQPPEKKTRHLSQLSGGERALVALALLFSIHSVRPAPFCVLDELDAPLDEQNIGRFLSLVEDFSDRTQFVIISHNKRTIAYGDQLIGVTMEERGVSKIIGVKTERQSA